MDTFPIFWRVADAAVAVFGGGAEAASKLRLMVKTSARVYAVAPHFERDVLALDGVTPVIADPLDWALPEDLTLAYAATGDAALDAQIAARLRGARVPVCAADQPAVSDFITPAIVDRDPVVVAIGTEGTAPVLAREIKARIERMLPASLGRVARKASALRNHVAATVPAGAPRRQFWHALFGPALDGAFERTGFGKAARALLSRDHRARALVSFVGAGAGGADLLTERARQRIDRADVILHDALVDPAILELARREAAIIPVGKRSGRHSMKQAEINAEIVAHAQNGMRVVRLKGGDPSIFGRLAEEIDAVQESGIALEIIPGVTAASVASAATLAPLTERGKAQELRIVTAHGVDGDTDVEAVDWQAAGESDAALAVYMGRKAAPLVERRLLAHGRAPDTPVVLVESAGREDQAVESTVLERLSDGIDRLPGSGPLVMLIGVHTRLGDADPGTLAQNALRRAQTNAALREAA